MSQARTATATFAAASTATTCNIPRGTATTPTVASSHPKILFSNAATLTCLQQLLSNNVASATRFKSMVDNEISVQATHTWNNPMTYGFRYWNSAMMYRITGATTYSDFAIARVDAMVASEEARIAAISAQNVATAAFPIVASDSYLGVGDMIAEVALVYDWCYDRLTPTQRTRWINYMNQTVFNVWNPSTAKWNNVDVAFRTSGWAINDPYNNYYYSFLQATMLTGLATFGENASAQGWITQFRTTKFQNQLLPVFNANLVGGGSQEGTGYGVSMMKLFELYDWWERSTGERIASLTPHTEASLPWMLNEIAPTLDHLAAAGDQARDSSVTLYDYHREYLLKLISLFPTSRVASVAKVVMDNSLLPRMAGGYEFYVDYLYQPPVTPAATVTDLQPTYWGSGTGQLVMRSAWGDKTAAFAQFSCGPLTQGHAHQDQGAFQIYRKEWLAPTTNIYTHGGIETGEAANNLVRFEDASGNVIHQVKYTNNKCATNALADNDNYTYISADVKPIYNGSANVTKSEREFLFIKPGVFVVFDRVASPSGIKRVWTMNLPDGTTAKTTISGDQLSYVGASARMDVYRVAPTGLAYTANTPVLSTGGDFLFNTATKRVDVVSNTGTQTNFLHVISTSPSTAASSITSVAASNAAGQTGVLIRLTDGRTVTVRFNNSTTGGTLDIADAQGTLVVTGALPTTVTAPVLLRN
jgi:hypothetical protein